MICVHCGTEHAEEGYDESETVEAVWSCRNALKAKVAEMEREYEESRKLLYRQAVDADARAEALAEALREVLGDEPSSRILEHGMGYVLHEALATYNATRRDSK